MEAGKQHDLLQRLGVFHAGGVFLLVVAQLQSSSLQTGAGVKLRVGLLTEAIWQLRPQMQMSVAHFFPSSSVFMA